MFCFLIFLSCYVIVSVQCILVRFPLKEKKNGKSRISQWLTLDGTPWVYCLVTNHCLLKLDLEFGLRYKVQDRKYVIFPHATGKAFQQNFKKYSEVIFTEK